jgi:hypothetical protein
MTVEVAKPVILYPGGLQQGIQGRLPGWSCRVKGSGLPGGQPVSRLAWRLESCQSFSWLETKSQLTSFQKDSTYFRTRVAVVDVVGMFPDIAGQQRRRASPRTGVSALEVEITSSLPSGFWTSQAQPEPKVAMAVSVNFFSKSSKLPKVPIDQFGQLAGRLAAALGAEAVPVESVVPDLGGIVEHTAAGCADDVLEGLVAKSVPSTRPLSLST